MADTLDTFTENTSPSGTDLLHIKTGTGANSDKKITFTNLAAGVTDENFTTADHDKLDNIETLADVTDATNVASAGAVMADGSGDDITGDLVFTEKADHTETPAAGKGYLWVKNTSPSTVVFTDDSGADTTLGSGGGGDDATGKQTLFIPATAMVATTTSGASYSEVETTAGNPELATLNFDALADEYAQFSIAMPKQWDEGTVTFKAFWCSGAADTDGVSWALQAVAISDNAGIDTAFGTAVVVDDANQGAAQELLVTAESGDITVSGTPAAGDLVYFQVFRDVSDSNDTATEDAQLIGVQVFWINDVATDD